MAFGFCLWSYAHTSLNILRFKIFVNRMLSEAHFKQSKPYLIPSKWDYGGKTYSPHQASQ